MFFAAINPFHPAVISRLQLLQSPPALSSSAPGARAVMGTVGDLRADHVSKMSQEFVLPCVKEQSGSPAFRPCSFFAG